MNEYNYAVQFMCGFTNKWYTYRKVESWSQALRTSNVFEAMYGDETRIIAL